MQTIGSNEGMNTTRAASPALSGSAAHPTTSTSDETVVRVRKNWSRRRIMRFILPLRAHLADRIGGAGSPAAGDQHHSQQTEARPMHTGQGRPPQGRRAGRSNLYSADRFANWSRYDPFEAETSGRSPH